MASLTKRKVHGHVYYDWVESQRINGQPRLVTQKFLGRVDQVGARLAAGPGPEEGRGRRIWGQHGVAPHRGASLLVAAINRALGPTSQAKMAEWYRRTALYHGLPFRPVELTSQRFWDHMGYVDQVRIQTMETALTQQMVKDFGLNLEAVVYDATNFYIWMDTMNPSELAQRGHQKQPRGDLKAVGLALMVTTDFNIPLFHAVYPGNRAGSSELHTVTEDLIARYQAIASTCDAVAIVYDKGNHSQANEAAVDHSPLHFVGSLTATPVSELLKIDLANYQPLAGAAFGGESAYRTEREIFGEQRTS